MHGIIHKALKDMVIKEFGIERWENIEAAVAPSSDVYISMQGYSDDVTYGLIGATSQELGESVETCLELFGQYWLLEAAPGSYADILDATSDQLIGFIANINSLHDRIISTFPKYVPPEFYIESLGSERYQVNYVSTRKGLCHFVIGLLKGLGIRFKRELVIESYEPVACESGEEWAFIIRVPE
ncbi:MAG: heme NO-binding domain-containing protein [Gammaproteobacteria bacterium]